MKRKKEAYEIPEFPEFRDSVKGLALWFVIMVILLVWFYTMTTIKIEHWIGMIIMFGLPALSIYVGKLGRRS